MNPDTFNDGNVYQFIDGRFQEKFKTSEEKWTFFSFIDNYLKWCSSKENSGETIEKVFEICRKHGYIPQYNVSGWTTFYLDNSRFSRDSKFVITPNVESTMITFSGEMRPYAAFFNHRAEEVELSPNGDRLINFYRYKDDKTTLEVWDTKGFKILFEVDTFVNKVWWTGPESFYYADAEGCLIKVESADSQTKTKVKFENEFAFAVDEENGTVLSLGDRIYMNDLETGEYEWFNEEMSTDSEIHLSKDGFRVFSNGILYRIGEEFEVLFESEKSCISRKLNNKSSHISIRFFEKDSRGIFALTDGPRYYLDGNGVRSVASYRRWSELSQEASELLNRLTDKSVFLLEESSVEERKRYVMEKLRKMETVVLASPACMDIYIVRPLGMDGPFVFEADVFHYKNLPFYLKPKKDGEENSVVMRMSDIHVIDTELIDTTMLETSEKVVSRMMTMEFGFELNANIFECTDPSPLANILAYALPHDEKAYQQSTDGEHFSLCTTLEGHAYHFTYIINDSGSVNAVKGKLLNQNGREVMCGKPVLRNDDGWYSVEADGSCVKLDMVDRKAGLALCTGNTVLWKSGKDWYVNGKPVPCDLPQEGHIALVSENEVILNKNLGLTVVSLTTGSSHKINIYEACYWYVLGLSDSGYLSMVHFVREKDNVTVDFGELNMNTGAWKNLDGTMNFTVTMSEGLGPDDERMWGQITNYVDLRKQKILRVGTDLNRPMLYKHDLTKGSIRLSRNGLRANYSKKWVSPIELNDGLYLIATTEKDEDNKKGDPKENEETGKDQEQPTPRRKMDNLRPELRIMDSRLGLRFEDGGRYGGIMYGPKGYTLRDRVHPMQISPDRNFVFATYDYPEVALGSFDVRTQTTYPQNPIRGTVLDFLPKDQVLIGLFNENGKIASQQAFDYRLDPKRGEPQKMLFLGHERSYGREYEFTEAGKDLGIHWFLPENHSRLMDKGILFCISESDEEKNEGKVGLAYVCYGIIENSTAWHTCFKSEYEKPTLLEIQEQVRKNMKFSASETLFAVFDMSAISDRARSGEYRATVIRGNTRMELVLQSPFYAGGRYYPHGCPLYVQGDTVTYSTNRNGHTYVERCKVQEGKEIEVLSSIDLGEIFHYVPIFADEDLLLVVREDGTPYFSKDWNTINELKLGKQTSYLPYGNLFLKEKSEGSYRFISENGEYSFRDDEFVSESNIYSYPTELKMSTGTLEWREGIFTIRL